jgi:hypothetical protein
LRLKKEAKIHISTNDQYAASCGQHIAVESQGHYWEIRTSKQVWYEEEPVE